jgi:hypothetical protein
VATVPQCDARDAEERTEGVEEEMGGAEGGAEQAEGGEQRTLRCHEAAKEKAAAKVAEVVRASTSGWRAAVAGRVASARGGSAARRTNASTSSLHSGGGATRRGRTRAARGAAKRSAAMRASEQELMEEEEGEEMQSARCGGGSTAGRAMRPCAGSDEDEEDEVVTPWTRPVKLDMDVA